MTTLKAVIGANYGDEGKGRVTDYFARETKGTCLVVCTNGGSQRGHTVYNDKGNYHVFQHLGSGTMANADTYLPAPYIINPMNFRREYYSPLLPEVGVYVNSNCLCSTPYDMMVNQIIEQHRMSLGASHGSCGVGIWETILRNEATIGEMVCMNKNQLRQYLIGVRDVYFMHRLKNKHIEMPEYWKSIYYSNKLIENFIEDFRYMCDAISFVDDSIIKRYDTVIFENGQGLLLDQNNIDSQNCTPSNTGSTNIKQIVENVYETNYKIEICYVTRSYLTRHGVGHLENQDDILRIKLVDNEITNKWNRHQGVFRYGRMDKKTLVERIHNDFYSHWDKKKAELSIAVTHVDEVKFDVSDMKDGYHFDKIYISNGVYKENMYQYEEVSV